jgi:hypothetical protein
MRPRLAAATFQTCGNRALEAVLAALPASKLADDAKRRRVAVA